VERRVVWTQKLAEVGRVSQSRWMELA